MILKVSRGLTWISMAVCLTVVLPAATKYRVPLDDVELTSASAEEILGRFVGEIHKLKAVQSKTKPKATVAVEVGGLKDKAIMMPEICTRGNLYLKVSLYPFSALALEFPEGKFLSKGKVKDAAKECLDPEGEGGIGRFQAQLTKIPLLRAGREVARLHLVRFVAPDKWFQQLPRKIGE